MKKITIIFVAFLLIIGCGKPSVPVINDDSGNSLELLEFRKINTAFYEAELVFEIDGMEQISGPIERWSGQVSVDGDDIDGTVKFFLKGESIQNKAFRLVLPAGQKKVTVVLDFLNEDGSIHRYSGTAHIVLNTNKIKVNLKLTLEIIPPQADPDDDGDEGEDTDIIGGLEHVMYVRFIHRTSGFLVKGATMKFYLGEELVREYLIDSDLAVPVYLPVQGVSVDQIDTPYTYEVTHPAYQTLTGTMKVGLEEWEVDGDIFLDYYNFVNFSRYMDLETDDKIPPVIHGIVGPSAVSSSIASFDIIATLSDDLYLGSKYAYINGKKVYAHFSRYHTLGVNDGVFDYIYSIKQEMLVSGTNTFSIRVYDNSGNFTEQSFYFQRN